MRKSPGGIRLVCFLVAAQFVLLLVCGGLLFFNSRGESFVIPDLETSQNESSESLTNPSLDSVELECSYGPLPNTSGIDEEGELLAVLAIKSSSEHWFDVQNKWIITLQNADNLIQEVTLYLPLPGDSRVYAVMFFLDIVGQIKSLPDLKVVVKIEGSEKAETVPCYPVPALQPPYEWEYNT